MVPRIRLRVSLRLFMLLCLGCGLVLAWLGLVQQRRALESQMSGVDAWTPFSGSAEILGNSTHVRGASIRSNDDLAALTARPEICVQLEYMGVYAPDAFEAWTPDDFPNLKKVSLANVDLGRHALTKLSSLSKLEMLLIFEMQHDPVQTLNDLMQFPRLRHLVLDVGPGVRWGDFPALKQLKILRISSPDMDADDLALLRQRLPNCDLIVPDR